MIKCKKKCQNKDKNELVKKGEIYLERDRECVKR